jgi:hypothetical protein
MSIQIEWDNEDKTIIRYTFLTGWTTREFHELYDKPSEMVAESFTQLIGIIIDDSRDSMPPQETVLAFGRTVREGRIPLAIVGVNPAAGILLEAARRGYQSTRPIFYADSLDQARKILQDYAEASKNNSTSNEG